MELITLENAKRLKEILLNSYIEDKNIELEYENIGAKINITGVSIKQDTPIFTDRKMDFRGFFNNNEEDNRLCLYIKAKKYMLYMNIGQWGYDYRISHMHLVLGSTYSFGSSKQFFSQLEISQFLEDNHYIYIVKNIGKLSGEGAIARINSGLKDDKDKKLERRHRLVDRLKTKTIFHDDNNWMIVHKINKTELINEDNNNEIFYGVIKSILNYSFTIEDIIEEDKKLNKQ